MVAKVLTALSDPLVYLRVCDEPIVNRILESLHRIAYESTKPLWPAVPIGIDVDKRVVATINVEVQALRIVKPRIWHRLSFR